MRFICMPFSYGSGGCSHFVLSSVSRQSVGECPGLNYDEQLVESLWLSIVRRDITKISYLDELMDEMPTRRSAKCPGRLEKAEYEPCRNSFIGARWQSDGSSDTPVFRLPCQHGYGADHHAYCSGTPARSFHRFPFNYARNLKNIIIYKNKIIKQERSPPQREVDGEQREVIKYRDSVWMEGFE